MQTKSPVVARVSRSYRLYLKASVHPTSGRGKKAISRSAYTPWWRYDDAAVSNATFNVMLRWSNSALI